MGVKGLLPCLQSITRSVSLERYRGLAVAVDAMSWLHKGIFACDVKALAKSQRGLLSESSSSSSSSSVDIKCVNFTMKKAENLRSNFGMDVVLVIDGDSLPCKKAENEKRRAERDEAFKRAVAAEQSGDSRAARRFYAQSCSVTHKIRYELIKACKQAGIAFLVAPYEADAQMARMAHTGVVDLVITEDSDTLVYGCPRVLFKVDFDTNQGQEIQLMRDLGKNKSPSFRNWTHDMFVFMCILSGCDYCDGIPGIGIKLAHKIVRIHRTTSKIFSALRVAGRMTKDFEEKFWIAFRTFRHQRVYCPSKQQVETLWPIVGSNHFANPNEVWPFLGEHIDPRTASRIADGSLHPVTKTDWSSALRQLQNSDDRQLSSRSVGEIHHRKKSSKRDRRSAALDGKENVWHSLVYGSGELHDADDVQRGNDRKNQAKHSKKDMFSFFPTREKKRGGSDDNAKSSGDDSGDDVRPPLTEIYLGGMSSGDNSTSKNKSKYVPPASHKDVPIHFHEYSSRLVGKSFKPMRKRRKDAKYGSKSSRCVQKIWEKSKAQTNHAGKTAAAVPPNYDQAEAKEDQGVSLFQRVKAADDNQCSNALDALESESYRADHSFIGHHYQPDNVPQMTQPHYSDDYVGHSSSTLHQSSSIFDCGSVTQAPPLNSDCSLTGAYTTVTAEPQDLFSVRPNDVYDNLFAEDATATTSERNSWDPSCFSSQYAIEPPTVFDSSFNPSLEFGSELYGENGDTHEEVYFNFQVPDYNHYSGEEYSQIDDGLLRDLAIMQQM